MGRVLLEAVLWVFLAVQLCSASYVSNCLDGDRCTNVRVIAQDQNDVWDALNNHRAAQIVDLHANLIEKFPDGALQSLNQLKMLNLSYNLLTSLQLQNVRSQNLETIDLTYNNLKEVSIPGAATLFIATRNKLHSVVISPNNRLKTLTLPMNKFDSLRSFINLRQLTDLDLSCNQIREIDLNVLSSMGQLKNLNLANNHIHTVSGQGSVDQLKNIDLSNNILTMVDETFNSFPNAEQLNLRKNKIVMWVNENINQQQLKNLDIRENDWDCKSLEKATDKLKGYNRNLRIVQEYSCQGGATQKSGICCIESASPYVDRLIKYRQQQFNALKIGSAQLNGTFDCSQYQPSPCDGDDNKVYEVANSALNSAEALAQASVQELNAKLQQERNVLERKQSEHERLRQQTSGMLAKQNDLTDYIDQEYRNAGLSGKSDPVEQLDALFAHYDAINDNLKKQINEEERRNQDKLQEINRLDETIQELEHRKDGLQREVDARNGTVIDYEKKIKVLQDKIAKRGN